MSKGPYLPGADTKYRGTSCCLGLLSTDSPSEPRTDGTFSFLITPATKLGGPVDPPLASPTQLADLVGASGIGVARPQVLRLSLLAGRAAGQGLIAVHAPDAHCWYCVPMQLNIPSDVQGPDLAEEEPPSEPVELPEPEPPPVGERVADGAGLVVAEAVAVADESAEVDTAADEEAADSVAVGAVIEAVSVSAAVDSVADPESSEAEVDDAAGAGVTGLT